ncbi:hypothetical protein EXIGLDRAFT_696726 [Exidia glandulosa HHB12029]|uniref:Uncharacterized protein n=1 Tax=Exidia glandulosa HHB12029 TaxID=1314781 RepID=A0A165N2R5_EXIGL|nr:hypothetical protein EXIGLDRAFT_696726 [Exidia glandulosa HHB12029]
MAQPTHPMSLRAIIHRNGLLVLRNQFSALITAAGFTTKAQTVCEDVTDPVAYHVEDAELDQLPPLAPQHGSGAPAHKAGLVGDISGLTSASDGEGSESMNQALEAVPLPRAKEKKDASRAPAHPPAVDLKHAPPLANHCAYTSPRPKNRRWRADVRKGNRLRARHRRRHFIKPAAVDRLGADTYERDADRRTPHTTVANTIVVGACDRSPPLHPSVLGKISALGNAHGRLLNAVPRRQGADFDGRAAGVVAACNDEMNGVGKSNLLIDGLVAFKQGGVATEFAGVQPSRTRSRRPN